MNTSRKRREEKIEFVLSHWHLTNLQLAKAMKDAGLYSKKTYYLDMGIRNLRKEAEQLRNRKIIEET